MSHDQQQSHQDFLNLNLTSLREALDCPTLDGFLSREWSQRSDHAHRHLIRQALTDHFETDFLDLAKATETDHVSASVTHCRSVGGVVFCRKPQQIGFDIEEMSRIQDRVVARVATQHELLSAPSSGVLWTAKEACFKSLRGVYQPATISEIEIGDWTSIKLSEEFDTWQFRANSGTALHHLNGIGLSFLCCDLFFSFFVERLN